MRRLQNSNTSRKSSFLRYLIPSRLHPIWPVTWEVICACSSFVWDLTPCWVMNVFNIPVSVFWGYPKSKISIYKKKSKIYLLPQEKQNIIWKLKPTVKKFIDEYKVILYILLTNLSKVGLHALDDFKKEFKDHRCIDILLCDRRHPNIRPLQNKYILNFSYYDIVWPINNNITYLNMEEGSAGNIRHWWSNLLSSMDDIHPESVHSVSSDVISINSGDEDLPFMIVNK